MGLKAFKEELQRLECKQAKLLEQRGIFGQSLAASFKLSKVTVRLGFAPGTNGMSADIV